ncbi:MAG: hypothetical protein A3B77_01925 [Candidatus Doudnabacteria bacterium RIFCSPHIGHO2_02_FULL_49_24]|nr:MAG: hypothetical protein A3B77_01925 [Candidatus Doudnabacteria bacterium RIFCSPHIGHO2_02_FULL_49_24]
MAPTPDTSIEFKPQPETPEAVEQRLKREQAQTSASEFAAAQLEQAPGSQMKPTADILTFPTPPAAELLNQKRAALEPEMSKRGKEFFEELEGAKGPEDAKRILNKAMLEAGKGNLPFDEATRLDEEARTRFQKAT